MAKDLKREERVALYLQDPEYWEKVFAVRGSSRLNEVMVYRLLQNELLKKIGERLGISPERVRQIEAKGLSIIWRRQEHFKKHMEQKQVNSMMGKALTHDEFTRIKELHFRGETTAEICRDTKRSSSTVDRAIASKSYEDYIQRGREIWGKYHGSEVAYKVEEEKKKPIQDRYSRLKEMKSRFDEVLAEFVVEEVEETTKALKTQIVSLQIENQRLRTRIEDLENPPFKDILKEKLEQRRLPEQIQEGEKVDEV